MYRITTVAVALALVAAAQAAEAQPVTKVSQPSVRIRYIVNDVAAATAFYTGKLGFKLDAQAGPYFAALSRGGVQLLLSPPKGPGGASQPMQNGERPSAGGGWNRMVLDTPDLQADVERLRKQGVHFRNDIVIGLGGNEILLDDPSGNAVELFQSTYTVNSKP